MCSKTTRVIGELFYFINLLRFQPPALDRNVHVLVSGPANYTQTNILVPRILTIVASYNSMSRSPCIPVHSTRCLPALLSAAVKVLLSVRIHLHLDMRMPYLLHASDFFRVAAFCAQDECVSLDRCVWQPPMKTR